MMENSLPRYTAVITHNQEPFIQRHHDAWEPLLVHLLTQIETEKTGVRGKIVDNISGEVIHRCRKEVY